MVGVWREDGVGKDYDGGDEDEGEVVVLGISFRVGCKV